MIRQLDPSSPTMLADLQHASLGRLSAHGSLSQASDIMQQWLSGLLLEVVSG